MGLFRKRMDSDQQTTLTPQTGEKMATFRELGMHCAGCQMNVEKTLKHLPGVKQYSVDLKNQSAAVVFDEGKTNVASIQVAIEDTGYHAESVSVTE